MGLISRVSSRTYRDREKMTSTEPEIGTNEPYLNAACQILKRCCEIAPKNTSIAIFENSPPNFTLLDSCSSDEKFHTRMKSGGKNRLVNILNKVNSQSNLKSCSNFDETIVSQGLSYQIIT